MKAVVKQAPGIGNVTLLDMPQPRPGPGAAPEASARQCLRSVRRSGQCVQIGLFGKPVELDMDQVVMKQLKVTGAFSHAPSGWPRALHLMSTGQVNTGGLVTRRLPLEEWEEAFCAFGDRREIKIVLEPSV